MAIISSIGHMHTKSYWKVYSILISVTYFMMFYSYVNWTNNNTSNNTKFIHSRIATTTNYKLSPILESKFGYFGATVTGINICDFDQHTLDASTLISQLQNDLYTYKFIILKKQCNSFNYTIPANIFVNFSSQFGAISPTLSYIKRLFNAQISDKVLVVSNDPSKGMCSAPTGLYHVDGMGTEVAPHPICFHQMIHWPNPGNGGTEMVDSISMLKLLKQMKPELYNEWRKLYLVFYSTKIDNDLIFPLVAIHPVTNEEYLFLGPLKTVPPWNNGGVRQIIKVNNKSFIHELPSMYIRNIKIVPYNHSNIQLYANDNTITLYTNHQIKQFVTMFDTFIEKEVANNNLYYRTQLEKGDLLIRSNMQLMHRAHHTSLLPVDQVGLRIMWRICIEPNEYPISTL